MTTNHSSARVSSPSPATSPWQHGVAAAAGGLVAAPVCVPIERLALFAQMQSASRPSPSRLLAALIGPRALRGVPIGVLSMTLGRGASMFGNDFCRQAGASVMGSCPEMLSSSLFDFASGFAGGMVETATITPLARIRAVQTQFGNRDSIAAVFRRIVHTEGLGGLYRQGPTVLAWDGFFYALLFSCRAGLKRRFGSDDNGRTPWSHNALSAVVATAGSNPLQVVLTRSQTGCMPTPSLTQLPKAVVALATKEGVSGLAAGLAPRTVSNVLVLSVVLDVYERTLPYLTRSEQI